MLLVAINQAETVFQQPKNVNEELNQFYKY